MSSFPDGFLRDRRMIADAGSRASAPASILIPAGPVARLAGGSAAARRLPGENS